MTILEMVENDPKFKRFCRRRSTEKLPTLQQRFARAHKAYLADLKRFMKPRGILSVLGEYSVGDGTLLYLQRNKNGEVVSTEPYVEKEAA